MKILPDENYSGKWKGRARHGALRLAFVVGMTAALSILRSVDPVSAGKWLPFPTSCGAVTGLPCVFCGMTRALHALLNGNLAGAIYFNWLAVPFLAVTLLIISLLLVEAARRRVIVDWSALRRINGRKVTIIGLSLFLLWTIQVYLALS